MARYKGATPMVAILLLLALPLAVGSPYFLHLIILFLLWVGLGESWNILSGFTGQTSFGHAAFFGVGAYGAALLYQQGVPLLIGGLAGALLAGIIAIPVGLISFRLRGPYFALTMLGMAEILRIVANNWRSVTNGSMGVLFPPIFADKLPFYYMILVLTVITIGVAWTALHSKAGYYFRAIREDQEAASALGINITLVKMLALVTSAVLTGMLGAFFAPYQGFIDPEIVFSASQISLGMIVVTSLGGMGNVWGPVIGACVVVALSELFRSTLGEANLLVYAALVIGIILFLPDGITGWITRRLAAGGSHTPAVPMPDVVRPSSITAESDAGYTAPEAPAGTGDSPIGTEIILRTDGLTKAFGGLVAVKNVSLEVRRGEILGLIGPNGAGKTTTLSLISGFEKPTSGRIFFDNRDVTGLMPHQLNHIGIARTFQIVRPLIRMTVEENVLTAALSRTSSVRIARERALETLEQVEMYDRRSILAGNLTLGERKRLELAKALATGPKLLLLDEVAAGLNAAEIKRMIAVLQTVRRQGVTIMAVEHVMEVIMAIADRLVVLSFGSVLAEGKPAEIAQNPVVIDAYLGGGEVSGHAAS